MSNMARWVGTAGALAGVSLLVSGCFPFDFSSDCKATLECAGPAVARSECVPGPKNPSIDESCGVFVSSTHGSDANSGTPDKPLLTLKKAVEMAAGKPLYACAENFVETLVLTQDAVIYGALDCENDWSYVGPNKKTVWTTVADEVPLRVQPGVHAMLRDMAVTATSAATPSGSSIAILAEKQAALDLTECEVKAGNGANGEDGEVFAMPASDGAKGSPGSNACTADQLVGGASVSTMCGAMSSISGDGGNGGILKGGDGSSGDAAAGGKGENGSQCTDGAAGDPGMDGPSGPGAFGAGTLSAEGYAGVPGNDGRPGNIGKSGGGGGGAKGGKGAGFEPQCSVNVPSTGSAGASGGSGGAGACGGAGGKGGAPGGASIGIVAIDAKLSFQAVKIITRQGGNGGSGSEGQKGGKGGPGGMGGTVPDGSGLHPGCDGGPGGNGGHGGKGGGGSGGPSIGIAFIGNAPHWDTPDLQIGGPGKGGQGELPTGAGADGIAKTMQEFQ